MVPRPWEADEHGPLHHQECGASLQEDGGHHLLRGNSGCNCATSRGQHLGIPTRSRGHLARHRDPPVISRHRSRVGSQCLLHQFPLSEPINTYINGAGDKRNWKMNFPVHQAIVAAHPTERFYDFSPNPNVHIEHAEFLEHLMVEQPDEGAGNDEVHEEEADEEIPHYGGDGDRTSSQRTQSRQEREEEDYCFLNDRMARMEVRQEEY